MFKDAFRSLTSTVLSTAKQTISDFTPTPENLVHGAFSHIAQQGIANLSYRSPIMSSLAQVALENFQKEVERKKKVTEYVASKESDWLRPKVKEKLGEGATDARVTKEMQNIVSKITRAIQEDGVAATKTSGVFKDYERFFEEYKKQKSEENQKQNKQTESPEQSESVDSGILDRIETNTKETANILSGMSGKQTGESKESSNDKPEPTPAKGRFIDPMTGMPSVTAAFGAIGGDILSKIFDDEMIDKFSTKVKNKFDKAIDYFDGFGVNKDTTDPVPEKKSNDIPDVSSKDTTDPVPEKKSDTIKPERGVNKDSIDDILSKISLDLSPVVDELKEVNKNIKSLEPTTEERSEMDRVLNSTRDKVNSGVSSKDTTDPVPEKKSDTIVDNALDYLGRKDKKTGKPKPTGKFGGKLTSVGRSIGGIAAGAALGVSGNTLLIAGTAAASYGVGELINSTTETENSSIGTWLYDKLNPKKSEIPDKLALDTAKRKMLEAELVAMSKKKTENNPSESAPVIVTTNNIANTTQSDSSPIVHTSIRNPESTFERIQMQDFWGRLK